MIHNTDCNEISETMLANQFKDSAILVTGATGMIGQNIVRIIMELNELYNANITLFAHVRNRNKCNIVLENYASIPNFKIVECDITSPFFKEELSGRYIDYIIHTVGVTGGSLQHLQRPMDTIDVSLRGTRNVLDLSKNTQCKGIVFTSSLEVYGNTGVDKPYIFETDGGYIDPVNVRSSYSESKRMCECMFASYAKQYGIPATVARLTASFGYGVSYADNRVFAQFAKNIRTADRSCNMVRVGDELAAELSSYGISVVHDRTLHDGESYNDAYENSLASIQSYLAKYPSIVYVLDLHRDAVQDANGTQYKLVTAEDPAAAQVSLIMGVAHDGWQDNLRLAIAVQEKLESQSPTLMRPITLLNYRYNQFAAPGSLLVEVGAAGNSLDEALRAARLFAKGFAETILGR